MKEHDLEDLDLWIPGVFIPKGIINFNTLMITLDYKC